jgi:predicted HD phosphohydrolase
MNHDSSRPRATFTALADVTADDAEILGAEFVRFAGDLPDRVLQHLLLLAHGHGGFPVDRLTHSLQAAQLAYEDGRDEEYVVCALLHDIGDTLGSYNHPDIAAAILKPFVSAANHWMVEKHGIFQSNQLLRLAGNDRDVRTYLRRHPFYFHAEEFSAKYDNCAFDPNRVTPQLAFFEPMVRSVFARPQRAQASAAAAQPIAATR